MDKLVLLRIGTTDAQGRLPVTLQISPEGDRPLVETTGYLPAIAPVLVTCSQWQTSYRSLVGTFRLGASTQVPNISSYQTCTETAHRLIYDLNAWLNADLARALRETLLRHLDPSDRIRFLIQAEDDRLQALPWHLWDVLADYPHLEVAFSPLTYHRVNHPSIHREQVRVLAILGSSQGIDVQTDRHLLQQLPQAEVQFLVEPRRWQLNDQLWTAGWDILFFAGHSQTCGNQGLLSLNGEERLTIDQFRYALKTAIANGLQLAIFNSCDGLGLARQLADLNLPQMVVMRQPVPDRIAQLFLNYFLTEFAGGQSFYLSVRAARERLQGWESEFPCASWLPAIVQNPVALPPTWQTLRQPALLAPVPELVPTPALAPIPESVVDRRQRSEMMTIVFTDLVGSTALKQHLAAADLHSTNQRYLDEILTPHRQRLEAALASHQGRLIKTMGDGHLLVFPMAIAAVQWAVALQRSHRDQPIPTPLGIVQVRVGMHTGSPLQDGSDLIGQEVDYAARVADLASGEQILLSEVTAVLVSNAHLSGVTTYHQGNHLLKGIGKKPVFELLYDGHAPRSLRQRSRPPFWKAGLVASLAVTALVIGLRSLGLFQAVELRAFDQLMRSLPPEPPDPRLLVVEATEADLQNYGFPLPDRVLAQAIERINRHQPSTIGLYLFRDQPREPGHAQFQTLIKQTDRLIALCLVGLPDNAKYPGVAPPPGVPIDRQGFDDLWLDPDGILRRQVLFMQSNYTDACASQISFSTVAALSHLAGQGIQLQTLSPNQVQVGNVTLHRLKTKDGAYDRLDDRGFQLLIRYRAGNNVAQRVSLTDLLQDKVPAQLIRDRVVLLGVVNSISNSTSSFFTPHSVSQSPQQSTPAVIVQAHLISQLLSAALGERPLLWVWSKSGEGLWIWIWAIIGAVSGWYLSRRWWWIPATGLMLVVLSGTCLVVLMQGGWIPLVPTAIAFLITTISLIIWQRYHQRS